MSSPDPVDTNIEEAASRLSEGLRSCRAVVSGYRALLSGEGSNGAGHVGLTVLDQERADESSVAAN